ncbi:hypothetical protein COW36_17975 [bacterium (Candidatus Blackallbacteria) CG17_big_fil_post_rev_8_21_14_2_50_48_46]|uniref:Thioredoxin-like fold domain-containing protein n=1 Tax=bacterium (Candidatus Blackallbacteria) CG17_big_fil_post_rev_8_21_14_2_50_48_46 TaxID=2014261 RepID=A0A2M7G0R1_9BACT|nr:MAG: hypothetical protein COW64_00750 [bacterium (Candidatus Blackallbacteria) CG18_big_fil_WC_8_21_14_2_50_49_26]PIW15304.1 MAG: hypothetical protein COW36_17975 [bacterium (Candidatus Blackallbacteria) CG17_big_fil_post_rev_8_21_14_2_50_48_46]PIW45186.1 MAG: hypothetical protein COW20_21040 [bacterium (Candidatus Blackallbacteria) CG13_big_fil_rev_8_21_14_2_50_49_14]
MLEAVAICDALCLSKTALNRQLESLQSTCPDFRFRWASGAESRLLMKKRHVKILPCLVIGEIVLYGVPAQEEILQTWQLQ